MRYLLPIRCIVVRDVEQLRYQSMVACWNTGWLWYLNVQM